MPTRIAALEAEIAEHKAALADPQLFEKDPARFNAVAQSLAAAQAAATAAEDEWLALELKREEIEG